MSFAALIQLKYPATGTDLAKQRRRALERVDRELSRGNFKTALSLIKQLQGKPGGLRYFGTVKLVPKKLSSLDKLELNGMNLSSLRPLVDLIMDSIERCIQFASLDQVSIKNSENLMHDEGSESSCTDDHFMCAQHEAGHFLVGYLLGVLPKGYKVPSIEALRHNKFAGGRVEFMGFEFLKEVGVAKILKKNIIKGEVCDWAGRGKISSKTLNNFSCVILGGLVAEHLLFGYSEGLHSDVEMLDSVLRSLGYTKSEADSQVRWAAFNTVLILHCHKEARSRLAEAMALGRSVGSCIDTIENAVLGEET